MSSSSAPSSRKRRGSASEPPRPIPISSSFKARETAFQFQFKLRAFREEALTEWSLDYIHACQLEGLANPGDEASDDYVRQFYQNLECVNFKEGSDVDVYTCKSNVGGHSFSFTELELAEILGISARIPAGREPVDFTITPDVIHAHFGVTQVKSGQSFYKSELPDRMWFLDTFLLHTVFPTDQKQERRNRFQKILYGADHGHWFSAAREIMGVMSRVTERVTKGPGAYKSQALPFPSFIKKLMDHFIPEVPHPHVFNISYFEVKAWRMALRILKKHQGGGPIPAPAQEVPRRGEGSSSQSPNPTKNFFSRLLRHMKEQTYESRVTQDMHRKVMNLHTPGLGDTELAESRERIKNEVVQSDVDDESLEDMLKDLPFDDFVFNNVF